MSEVAKGTRVAYVKFMANALKDGKGGVKIVDEKPPRSTEDDRTSKATFKSIIVCALLLRSLFQLFNDSFFIRKLKSLAFPAQEIPHLMLHLHLRPLPQVRTVYFSNFEAK